ncbi:hypothetical protein KSS87_006011, partial [Heliosperma pusillum]
NFAYPQLGQSFTHSCRHFSLLQSNSSHIPNFASPPLIPKTLSRSTHLPPPLLIAHDHRPLPTVVNFSKPRLG